MKYHFKGQNPNEKVELLLRRHWIFFGRHGLIIFLLILVLFIFFILGPRFLPLFKQSYLSLTLWLGSFYLLFIWLYFFLAWLDYYLDVWIITNQRIIDIKQKGLFKREIFECQLSQIRTVTIKVKGIFPTFINYGQVHLQIAGSDQEFVLKQMPQPARVKDLISQLTRKKIV